MFTCEVCNESCNDFTKRELGICAFLGCKKIESLCDKCFIYLASTPLEEIQISHPREYQLWFDHQQEHTAVSLI